MLKNYIYALLAITPLYVTAQPQFTSSNCFQVNDSSKLGFAIVNQNFDDFIPATGDNYTWDFSTTGSPGPWTSWTTPTISYKFRPASQSNHTPFYNTEINEYSNIAFARDVFFSYSANQDTLYNNGLYTSSNYVYLPPIPYLSFPLNYTDSIYTHTKQYSNPNQPTNATGSVTRYWIFDGYGTVKFPYGTATNVYRIRTKQIDSSYIISMATPYEEMIWFRQSDGIPVLRFQKNSTLISAYYASAEGTNSISGFAKENDISVYPNPFTNSLTVDYPTEKIIQLRIFDTQGKLVHLENNPKSTNINTSQLDKGMYFIEVVGTEVIKRKKITK